MTASVIEEVMHTRSPNVSVAHAITSHAGTSARSFAASAASLCSPSGSLMSSGVAWFWHVRQVARDLTGRLPSFMAVTNAVEDLNARFPQAPPQALPREQAVLKVLYLAFASRTRTG